jgi:opacity protein-like surface antigen
MKRIAIISGVTICLVLAATMAMADTRQEQEIRDYGTNLVGVGVSLGSVTSDDDVYFDGTSGSGFNLMVGHRFNDRLTLEVSFSGLTVSDKLYEVMSAGPRLDLVRMSDSTIIPWVSAHVSHISLEQELNTQTASLSGLGWAAMGGVDLRVGKKGFIQIAFRRYPFTSDLKVGGTTPDKDLESALSVFSVTYVAHTW